MAESGDKIFPENETPPQIQILDEIENSERQLIQTPKDSLSVRLNSAMAPVVRADIAFKNLKDMGILHRDNTLEKNLFDIEYADSMKKEGVIVVHDKHLELDNKSFYILSYDNRFRYVMIWLTEWKQVQAMIAIYDYSDKDNLTLKNHIIDISTKIFDVIFIMECLMKVIASGLIVHKNSYLRNGWNLIDFVVVISAIIELLPNVKSRSLQSIRAFRSIRPLRTINAVPSMKKLVGVLINSLPQLGNVVALLSFIVLLFAILGLNQFSGNLYYRCRTTEFPINSTYWPILEGYDRLCSSNPKLNTCPTGSFCGHPSTYGISLKNDQVYSTGFINYGIVNFDNIGYSILTVFQVLTIQGWSQIMYNYMDSTSEYFSPIFFGILVVFGSYFLLNLILAVIIDAYQDIDFKEKKKAIEKMEALVKKRELKFNAIKTMYKMMKISQQKKQLAEAGGYKFKQSFFDVVFELVRVRRYGGVQQKAAVPILDQVASKMQNQLFIQIESNSKYEKSNSIKIEAFRKIVKRESEINLTRQSQNDVQDEFNNSINSMKINTCDDNSNKNQLKMVSNNSGAQTGKANKFDFSKFFIQPLKETHKPKKLNLEEEKDQENTAKIEQQEEQEDISFSQQIDNQNKENSLNMNNLLVHSKLYEYYDYQKLYNHGKNCLQLFSQKMKFNQNDEYDLENGISPRINFDSFLDSFTAVFQVLQGEQWQDIMYDVARSSGKIGIIYFVTLIIIGQIILLKLFLAVLLENFEDKRIEIEKIKASSTSIKTQEKFYSLLYNQIKAKIFSKKKENLYLEENKNDKQNDFQDQLPSQSLQQSITVNNSSFLVINNKSLFILSSENKLRVFIIQITDSKYFEGFILILILLSSVMLAIQNPLEDSQTTKNIILSKIDIGVTAIFTLEVVLKVLAKGLIINGQYSYLRQKGNIADLTIVVFSLISAISKNSQLSVFKVLRLIRVLRPLRVISRNEGLQLALQTLVKAIPQILNVLLVSIVFYLLFGIFCVSLLKGSYYKCEMIGLPENFQIQITDIYSCINYGGIWSNSQLNFDNIVNAMALIYTMGQVNWINFMWQAVDAKGPNLQPEKDFHKAWIIFFIVFMIIFTFFLMNLFVGVIVSTFQQEKQIMGKNFLLTQTQKEWLQMKMILLNTKPPTTKNLKTKSFIRKICFLIVNHRFFETTILVFIILNTLVLTLKWYEMPNNITHIIMALNYFFAAIFTVEAIIKIISFGIQYFKDNWNVFDFMIVLATIIGVILDYTTNVSVGAQTTLVRAFRVARVFRIIQRAKFLRIIIDTFIVTLPSIANVGGLLLLIIFIYAVLGVQMFAGIKLQTVLNEQANFQTFGRAFLTLIRLSTGEDWDDMMVEMTMKMSPINQCDNVFNQQAYNQNKIANGCGNTFAMWYLCTFNLIVSTIFLNLFVAIILESFEDMNKKENQLLSEKNMTHLRNCWAQFDQEGSYFIEIQDLIPFLIILGKPLGLKQKEAKSMKLQQNFLKKHELPTYNNIKHYYYYDVIQSLTQLAYIKIESKRKLKQKLMNADIEDKQNITADYLDDIKQELEFESKVFKAKTISAVEQAKTKEQKIYKKIVQSRDATDSQHIWAGGQIKQMYKSTKMHFQHGKRPTKIINDSLSEMIESDLSNEGQDIIEKYIKRKSTIKIKNQQKTKKAPKFINVGELGNSNNTEEIPDKQQEPVDEFTSYIQQAQRFNMRSYNQNITQNQIVPNLCIDAINNQINPINNEINFRQSSQSHSSNQENQVQQPVQYQSFENSSSVRNSLTDYRFDNKAKIQRSGRRSQALNQPKQKSIQTRQQYTRNNLFNSIIQDQEIQNEFQPPFQSSSSQFSPRETFRRSIQSVMSGNYNESRNIMDSNIFNQQQLISHQSQPNLNFNQGLRQQQQNQINYVTGSSPSARAQLAQNNVHSQQSLLKTQDIMRSNNNQRLLNKPELLNQRHQDQNLTHMNPDVNGLNIGSHRQNEIEEEFKTESDRIIFNKDQQNQSERNIMQDCIVEEEQKLQSFRFKQEQQNTVNIDINDQQMEVDEQIFIENDSMQ